MAGRGGCGLGNCFTFIEFWKKRKNERENRRNTNKPQLKRVRRKGLNKKTRLIKTA